MAKPSTIQISYSPRVTPVIRLLPSGATLKAATPREPPNRMSGGSSTIARKRPGFQPSAPTCRRSPSRPTSDGSAPSGGQPPLPSYPVPKLRVCFPSGDTIRTPSLASKIHCPLGDHAAFSEAPSAIASGAPCPDARILSRTSLPVSVRLRLTIHLPSGDHEIPNPATLP